MFRAYTLKDIKFTNASGEKVIIPSDTVIRVTKVEDNLTVGEFGMHQFTVFHNEYVRLTCNPSVLIHPC